MKLVTLFPLKVSLSIYLTVAVKKCGIKPFLASSDIISFSMSKDIAHQMVAMLHDVFDNDSSPSLCKMLKSKLHLLHQHPFL